MAKTKPATHPAGALSKGTMKWRKHGSIQKKKNQKYKNTPVGKVNLINGSKPQNNNNNNAKQQKQFQKGNNASPQKSPKQNGASNSPHIKNNNKKARGQQAQESNEKKKLIKELVPKDEDYDSDDDDYNEGIIIQEEISMVDEGDLDDDEEETDDEDDDVPDIFGTSLADDTEESDHDFEAEEEMEELESPESPTESNKGVKMFPGTKPTPKDKDLNTTGESTDLNTSASTKDSSFASNDDDDDEDEDDDNDDDDDDDEDLDDEEDESVDEEIEGEEEEEDDEDDDDDSDEEEDDDEDDEDEEDEEEEEESGPGLKALLGNSILDDEDDEDFEGDEDDEDDEDDDISDEDDEEAVDSTKKTPEKKGKNAGEQSESPLSPQHVEKQNPRTIFVGNLPVHVKKEQLKKLFKQYGTVATVRLRGIVPIEENVPKKVAATTRKIHPKLKSIYAYVTFETEEAAKSALAANGQLYEGHYLRVDTTVKAQESDADPKRCVFLGNLPFKADNNCIWEHFKDCGEIESVRIVRHNKTGVGKGIGYVNFKNPDAVALALELDGTSILNRPVRVKPYSKGKTDKKPRHEKSERNKRTLPQNLNTSVKKFKSSTSPNTHKKGGPKAQRSEDNETSPRTKVAFHGQKSDQKKKKRPGKLEKQKRIMAAKLTAKTKKPAN